jgi:hypothetical protein
MAFDNPTRNRLNSFVAECRNILSEEFTSQLKRDYGMDPDSGAVTEIEKLTQLDDARRETARILRDTLLHYVAGSTADAKKARQEAMRRIIREQAFTVLNRLCALRMAEARKLFVESVGNGLQSQGFQLYARLAGTALGESSDAYRCYLFSVFDELAVDLAVVFNRFSPEGRLFPSGTVLQDILSKLNAPEMVPLWEEDETIGWIYQYFNDPAERKKMRDESAAPRNSRELAVRNQFFTPRYVVEFLTDNTLGRIWYEMTQGQTSLKDACRYMVRRPDEVFLSEGSTEPLSSPSRSLGIPARDSSIVGSKKSPAKKSAKAAAAAATAAAKAEDATGRNAHPTTVADLLLTGTDETFPEFSADSDAQIQQMIEFAHSVDSYVRHPNEEASWQWLEELKRQHLEAMQYDGVTTQDILDALFLTCRADRHGGDGTVYKDRWFVAACNEVRRRVLNSRRTDLSQEELLKQPVFIPYRAMKDPREIRMLDPACGSMHFGLYAFDLFEQIYLEFWLLSDPDNESSLLPRLGGEGGRRPDEGAFVPLRETFDSDRAFPSAVPKLIIEHNIHGIDIDRRATQIAGLSLWLRAQKSWQKQKVKPQDRPRIVRSNIVCAEPMPGNSELLEEFLQKHLSSDAEGQLLTVLVRKVFEAMKLAGEAGSLLKIEEEIAGEVEKAKQLWDKSREKKQQSLFDNRPQQVQQEMDFVRKIDDATFWDEAENLIYAALRAYAERAENGGGFQRRLFAEDAARGFAFIDVCRNRYDVVLMNPPFGECSLMARTFVESAYEDSKSDLFASFFERGLEVVDGGFVGALTSRLGLFVSSLEEWRMKCLLSDYKLQSLADLGHNVLDNALVEAAAYVSCKSKRPEGSSLYWAAGLLDAEDKDAGLVRALGGGTGAKHGHLESLARIPGKAMAYWLPEKFLSGVLTHEAMSEHAAEARVGLQTDDDFRFLNLTWECDSDVSGEGWRFLAKGGEYSPFYDDFHLVVNWANDAAEMRAFIEQRYSWTKNARSVSLYGQAGLTYPERTTSEFSVRPLPIDTVFSIAGPAILAKSESARLALCSLAYTRIFRIILEMFIGGGDAVHSGSAARHYKAGILNRFPVPSLSSAIGSELAECGRGCIEAAMGEWVCDETSRLFWGWPTSVAMSIATLTATHLNAIENSLIALEELTGKADILANRLYGLDDGAEHFLQQNYGIHPATLSGQVSFRAVTEQMQMPIDQLVDEVAAKRGFSRQTTKLAYWTERRYESIALLNETSVRQIVDARRASQAVPHWLLKQDSEGIVSHFVGLSFGRWDIRYATGKLPPPELPDPFAALPVCPPGQLQNMHGLPVRPEDVPADYVIQIPWDGIIVDDPGHALDIERRIREVIEIIWVKKLASGEERVGSEGKELAAAPHSAPATPEAIEQEACEILGVRSLREYFQKPNKFFADHLKRYSKSRRQAPIYWALSTESGGYTLWIYYHRLTDQTLFHAVNNFVEPKLKQVTEQLSRLKAKSGRSSAEEKELSTLTVLESELTDFRDELLCVAKFWKPNLNDGVLITASPLWKLFRFPKWRKDLKACWEELEKGDYDWAHLALSIWPDRVVRTAHKDRSIAIAHDLESDLWHEVTVTKPGKGKNSKPTTKTEWQPKKLSEAELDKIAKRKT